MAASMGTSVSALVKRYLTELGSGETEQQRLKRQEQALRARIQDFRAADRLPRDEVYRRDA